MTVTRPMESTATYSPPFFLFNRHLETIFPALFRKVKRLPYATDRIVTPDDDFLDIYQFRQGSPNAVIISHGLEGNAWRPYVTGMVNACFMAGYDVITWNFRGCGDEMNRKLRFYHSGATEDLDAVTQFAISRGYEQLNLIGFSLGGNLTLKFLGERTVNPTIKKAVTLSVPMDLLTSCRQISRPGNRLYARRFLKSLKEKVLRKSALMPELDISGIKKIKTIMEFDDRYTAPLHGFNDAMSYYHQCSAIRVVAHIKIPTLIINAANDPFLSRECYPEKLLRNHPYVQFENPSRGGHVGFAQFNKNGLYWSEERTVNFLQQNSLARS